VELTSVLYEVNEANQAIATVTLNRPEALNASTLAMERELRYLFETADADPDVRCIIVTGAGRGFCAGDDIKAMWGAEDMSEGLATMQGPQAQLSPMAQTLLSMRTPTIAAVNGAAVGFGMDLALLCDLRLASTTARFGQLFVKMGLIADIAGFWVLPQLVGRSKALELLTTGELIDAAEALRLGIVSRVVEPEALLPEARALAARIAANPPLAVAANVAGLRRIAGSRHDDLGDHADFLGRSLTELFQTADHREAVQAFLERRPGHFTGI
jgi:enoyl-CoA hydratase/carnithine racemase